VVTVVDATPPSEMADIVASRVKVALAQRVRAVGTLLGSRSAGVSVVFSPTIAAAEKRVADGGGVAGGHVCVEVKVVGDAQGSEGDQEVRVCESTPDRVVILISQRVLSQLDRRPLATHVRLSRRQFKSFKKVLKASVGRSDQASLAIVQETSEVLGGPPLRGGDKIYLMHSQEGAVAVSAAASVVLQDAEGWLMAGFRDPLKFQLDSTVAAAQGAAFPASEALVVTKPPVPRELLAGPLDAPFQVTEAAVRSAFREHPRNLCLLVWQADHWSVLYHAEGDLRFFLVLRGFFQRLRRGSAGLDLRPLAPSSGTSGFVSHFRAVAQPNFSPG
jgi:hypothetical protein